MENFSNEIDDSECISAVLCIHANGITIVLDTGKFPISLMLSFVISVQHSIISHHIGIWRIDPISNIYWSFWTEIAAVLWWHVTGNWYTKTFNAWSLKYWTFENFLELFGKHCGVGFRENDSSLLSLPKLDWVLLMCWKLTDKRLQLIDANTIALHCGNVAIN